MGKGCDFSGSRPYFPQVGKLEAALKELQRVVTGGNYCASTLAIDPWLDPLRPLPGFEAALRNDEQRRREALEVYQASGGNELVGGEERD